MFVYALKRLSVLNKKQKNVEIIFKVEESVYFYYKQNNITEVYFICYKINFICVHYLYSI